jgi:putative transposase
MHFPKFNELTPVGRDSVEPTNSSCGRRNPEPGVTLYPSAATIAFLTVCTAARQIGLANTQIHEALIKTWTTADDWLVGHYVIMPDHIHLFCAPQTHEFSIEQWNTYWKRHFRRICKIAPRFQSRGFHHRLRRSESYDEKIDYVLQNPVRAGLVKNAEDWPLKGELNVLRWD